MQYSTFGYSVVEFAAHIRKQLADEPVWEGATLQDQYEAEIEGGDWYGTYAEKAGCELDWDPEFLSKVRSELGI
jgi:hypothetical protein